MYVVNCSLIASTINFFITVLLLYGALMVSIERTRFKIQLRILLTFWQIDIGIEVLYGAMDVQYVSDLDYHGTGYIL